MPSPAALGRASLEVCGKFSPHRLREGQAENRNRDGISERSKSWLDGKSSFMTTWHENGALMCSTHQLHTGLSAGGKVNTGTPGKPDTVVWCSASREDSLAPQRILACVRKMRCCCCSGMRGDRGFQVCSRVLTRLNAVKRIKENAICNLTSFTSPTIRKIHRQSLITKCKDLANYFLLHLLLPGSMAAVFVCLARLCLTPTQETDCRP